MSGMMTAAAVVGGIGAGAGYLMAQGNKRPKTFGPETKIPSLTNVAGGEQLLNTLRDRASGKGLGFTQDISDFTKQFANQRMAQLREQEMPAIKAQASGMGLGRSTLALNRGALAQQAAARDIDSRHAQLTMANEQQKRKELSEAIGGLHNFVTAEGAQLSGAAQLATQQRDAQLNQEIALDKREFDARQRLVKGLTKSVQGISSGLIGGMGGGGMGENFGNVDLFNQLQGGGSGGLFGGANVNISPSGGGGTNSYNSEDIAFLMKMIQGGTV